MAPGVSPGGIVLEFDGAESVRLGSSGELIVHAPGDVVVKVGERPVRNTGDLFAAVAQGMLKAAVIVVMTFFPMLINTIAGFAQVDAMGRDMMRAYGASYWQCFFKLRLPSALPFIFNALKINSTLAMIGAIVAEFFGSPIAGMGFRISVEVARMNVDVVWATIAVAALAGSLFYWLIALVERGLTFWHPSYRE